MTSPKYQDPLVGPGPAIWLAVFERQKAFAEHALNQLDDSSFFARPAVIEGTRLNSVAVIVQHLAGNMRSRWTDFLTTDGEKPWRDRDSEFVEIEPTAAERERLMRAWDDGWALVLGTAGSLTLEDLERRVMIRGVPHTVEAAVIRQIDHYATHVGQIVTTARLFVPEDRWQYFTIPPGESAAFNRAMGMKEERG